ncbi:acyltransferase family protein [Piscinibacter terrae]|nr:acyltransferase [Albitalea terrae]
MSSPGFSRNVNGFRGLCVSLVFLHHVAHSGLPPAADPESLWQLALQDLFMSFGYGVELFFMISGYVIVQSLRRHASVGGFLADRALRIFPVWLPLGLVLGIACVVVGKLGFVASEPAWWLPVVLANLALLPPLVPLPLVHPASWSLSYEWLFYLACAALALWSRSATRSRIVLVLWIVAAAWLIAAIPRSLFFLPGVALALAPSVFAPLQRATWLGAFSLPLMLACWYSTGIFAAQFGTPLWSVVAAGQGIAVLVALLAGTHVFACVGAPDDAGWPLLRSRAAQHLGRISYSFYLMHPVAMAVVKPIVVRTVPEGWPATLVFLAASALVSWALAYASWALLEQRFARWLKSRGTAPASGTAALPQGQSA